jgi:hypothetical protein
VDANYQRPGVLTTSGRFLVETFPPTLTGYHTHPKIVNGVFAKSLSNDDEHTRRQMSIDEQREVW